MSDEQVTEAELQAYVDRRLSSERAAEVSAWLLTRPSEADRIAAYRAHTSALREALRPIVDEPLPPVLDLRLRRHSQRRGASLRSAAMAASVAVLALLSAAGGWTLREWTMPPTAGTAALAREAASSYAVFARDAVRPVELAAFQRTTLDRWFSERMAKPIRAPDLQSVGLTFIGGRLVAAQHGPAGLYLYRDKAGRPVALYLRPMAIDSSDRMTLRPEGGVAGWTWADEGLGFGIYGAMPSGDLHDAANTVRKQFRRA